MCKNIVGLLALIAVFILPVALSQDQLEAKDILGWFPEGYYRSIRHRDLSGVSEEGLALFKELVGDLVDQKVWPLPYSMIGGVVSATLANLINYREVEVEKPDEKVKAGKTQRLGKNIVSFVDNIVSFVDNNGDEVCLKLEDRVVELFVFRYEDPDFLLKKAIETGEITETVEQRFERKIFTFNWRNGGKFYLYPAVTGEVLVSADLPALIQMIEAGMGQGPSVVDDPDYRDFIEMLPTLGQSWIKTDAWTRLKAQLRTAEKWNAPEEYIEEIHERLNKMPVVCCFSSYIGDVIIRKTIGVYAEEETAESAYEKLNETLKTKWARVSYLPEPGKLLIMKEKRSTTATRDGNRIVLEVEYDREHVDLIKKQIEAGGNKVKVHR